MKGHNPSNVDGYIQKKYDVKGKVRKFKARLVDKGYSQREGIDYSETFAPVAKFKSIRILAALAAKLNLKAYQDDVPTAFLKANLKERVWMAQPEGYKSSNSNELCFLKKTLYGLKQSPREWNLVLHNYLLSRGFRQSKADPCIYVNLSKEFSKTIYVGIYVDDIVTIGEPKDANIFREHLRAEFGITEGGLLEWYLGIAFDQLENGNITLNQKVYLDQKLN